MMARETYVRLEKERVFLAIGGEAAYIVAVGALADRLARELWAKAARHSTKTTRS